LINGSKNDKSSKRFQCLTLSSTSSGFLKTISKQDQIIESLHSIHIFIKEHYLSAGNGIENSFTSFYYIYSARREKPASKIAISKILVTDLDIKVFQKRLGKDRYK